MNNRFVLAEIITAIVVFAAVGAFLAWRADVWHLATSQTLRVATAPLDENEKKFLTALRREVASQRVPVQLVVVETASPAAGAEALQEKKVDAAVVRSDDPVASEGRALFILRNLYFAALVPATAPVDDIAKLKGKKIGIVSSDGAVDPMTKVVLDFYGFDDKSIVLLNTNDLVASLQRRQISAVMVVGPARAGPLVDAIEAFRKATKRPPKFLDINQAKAIVTHYAVYNEAEISAGAFSGSPPVPSEKVETISAHLLLISRPALSNRTAGEITRLMLATKTKVAAILPDAGELAAPSTEKSELLPAHPGTVAYLNGEQASMFDDPTNLILLGSMLAGFLGSVAAWVSALRNNKKVQELKRRMRRLPVLLSEAKVAGPEQLDAMQDELDEMSEWLVQKFLADEISPEDFDRAEAKVSRLRVLIDKERSSVGRAEGDERALLPDASSSSADTDAGGSYGMPDRRRRVRTLEHFSQPAA
jgi:TRAP-type uncharacterized transport system substrate-binding protein